jgi:hypothetical protein
MALGRYMVDAVVLEGRSPTEPARTHGISRSWMEKSRDSRISRVYAENRQAQSRASGGEGGSTW